MAEMGDYVLVGNEVKDFENHGFVRMNDLGLTRAVAICTAIEAYRGVLFHPEKHKKRLLESAEAARIPIEKAVGFKSLFQNLSRLAVKCRHRELIIFVYATGGLGTGGLKPKGRPSLFAFAVKEKRRIQPMAVTTTRNHWRSLPGAKTTNYLPGYIASVDAGWPDDVFYIDYATNEILESTTRNILIVYKDACLHTPPTHGKILNGITRQIFLGLMRGDKEFRWLVVPSVFSYIEERQIKFDQFVRDVKDGTVTGVVAASTTTAVPVRSVDGLEIPISQKTKDLCAQFLKYREEYYAKHK